jgi:NCS1 family nucleobase:cation symporter-1
MFVSPQKIRYLFLAKAILVPPTWLALLIWAFVKVPPNISLLTPKNTLSGNELRWARLSAFNSAFGLFASAGLNMSNFTVSNRIVSDRLYPCDNHLRDMRKTKGRACNYDLIQTKFISFLSPYIQLLVIPIGFTLASFVGIAVTSAGVSLYGQVLWDPLKLIDHWDNRACAFFTSLTFILSTLGANISSNSLDAGIEMAAMYPRYINIRRGQVICAFLGGWALCPWKILARWGTSLERYTTFPYRHRH